MAGPVGRRQNFPTLLPRNRVGRAISRLSPKPTTEKISKAGVARKLKAGAAKAGRAGEKFSEIVRSVAIPLPGRGAKSQAAKWVAGKTGATTLIKRIVPESPLSKPTWPASFTGPQWTSYEGSRRAFNQLTRKLLKGRSASGAAKQSGTTLRATVGKPVPASSSAAKPPYHNITRSNPAVRKYLDAIAGKPAPASSRRAPKLKPRRRPSL